MEEKYNQLEDENASDTSEKSKTGLGTPEKKLANEQAKASDAPAATAATSAPKSEVKDEDEQDSDHEDPHGKVIDLLIIEGYK